MRDEYDFSTGHKNPYIKKLKKPVTIRLEQEILAHFKKQSEETGIPYQTLINLYLLDCVKENRTLKMKWAS